MNIFPDGIDKLIPKEVINKAYDDTVSPPAKEIGKIGTDIIKTARLFLAPFQLGSAFQDRFEKMLDRIRNKIPEERQIQAAPEIAGPAINQMQYLDDTTVLWELFEELLTSTIDYDQIDKVHPSFVHIISQLSRDEAVILSELNKSDFEIVDTMELNKAENKFQNLVVEKSTLPEKRLLKPNQVSLYYTHLSSLNLVEWPVEKQDPIRNSSGQQTGVRRYTRMRLTEFGRLFISACVPENGLKNE